MHDWYTCAYIQGIDYMQISIAVGERRKFSEIPKAR
jgi:hypothetical protein